MPLRPVSEADAAVFRAACAGDRIERMTCRPVAGGARDAAPSQTVRWTYLTGADAAPAGWVNLFDFNPRNRSAEFGFGLVPALRGKGLARPMLAEAFDRAFAEFGLNKLYCQTAAFNLPAIRLAEGLGMTRDGVLRAHHELDGTLYDDHVYSILRAEWQRDGA